MPLACPSCHAANDDAADSCFTCGTSLLVTLRQGSVLAGRYEIQSQLGKGGMGVVYRAHDTLLDETVAIKVLRPEVARDVEISRRFQSEIKLARKVSHRNVCRIHEYGEAPGGLRYISMEMLEGVDLRQVLRQGGGLPPDEAFRTALQIADGLQAIHEVGVIHRDLKTPNIMRDARGTVRLMDFGIAKEWGAANSATATGLVMGTPEYMSPEQARGAKIDFRSDIYALGIIVYELFTGHVPFRAETPLATILMHLQEPPPLDGPAGALLPESVKGVLRRSLAKQADDRYPTVQDMAEELRQAQRAPAVPSRGAMDTMGLPATPTLGLPTEVPTQARVATQAAAAHAPAPLTLPTLAATQSAFVPTMVAPVPTPVPHRAPPQAARRGAAGGRTGLWVGLGAGALVVIGLTGFAAWKLVQPPVTTPASAAPATIAAGTLPGTMPPVTAAPATQTAVPPTTVPATVPPTTVPPPVTLTPRPSAAPATAPPVTQAPGPSMSAAVLEQVQDLASSDAGGRWHAAEALGNMGGEADPAVAHLVPLLQDRTEVVSWRAAEALGKIGPSARAALPALVAALGGRPGLLTTEAAKAMGRIGAGTPAVAPALGRALHSDEVYTRREAAKALARVGPAAGPALDDLVSALRDKDNVVRTESARALGRMGSGARSAAAALTVATRDSDRLVAQTAAQALELVQK